LILLNLCHGFELFFIIAGQVFNIMRWGNELDLIHLSDNFTRILGLIVLLTYIARFIVEQTMGVTHPGHTAEKYSKRFNIQGKGTHLHCFFAWRFLRV
jgi:hypothetical protein